MNKAEEALDKIGKLDYKLINCNIFEYEYEDISNKDKVLIIGNPPWATNSNLTSGKHQERVLYIKMLLSFQYLE